MNGKRIYNGLAVFVLGCAGAAWAAFPQVALAAGPGTVSVTVNPTTGYFEPTPSTFRVPPGVQTSPVKDVAKPLVEKLPGGGLGQSISSGIEITALKQQGIEHKGVLKGRVTAGVGALRGAATRCFTSFRCNMAAAVAASGIQKLLDGVDWVMTEGSQVVKPGAMPDGVPVEPGYSGWYSGWEGPFTGPGAACMAAHPGRACGVQAINDREFYCLQIPSPGASCNHGFAFARFKAGSSGCPVGTEIAGDVCLPPRAQYGDPVSITDITNQINANYNPEPSDFPFLTPEIDLGGADVLSEITDAPTLITPPKTTTIYDADGNPIEVQEVNRETQFTPRDNPSKQPALDAKEVDKTTTYDKDGNKTQEKVEEQPKPAPGPGAIVVPPGTPPEIDIPTDCDLMPSLCEWMEWTKEEPEKPEFDGPTIESLPITYVEKNLSAPEGVCPAPFPLDLNVMGTAMTVQISFQPFCDLAANVRGLYLTMCAFFSLLLLYRGVI